MTTSHLNYETPYWDSNLVVIGIDEAGRGCLAGPLAVGAVAFHPEHVVEADDSKSLSFVEREHMAASIKKHALAYGIGLATVEEIDTLGLAACLQLASKRACHALFEQLNAGSLEQSDATSSGNHNTPHTNNRKHDTAQIAKTVNDNAAVFSTEVSANSTAVRSVDEPGYDSDAFVLLIDGPNDLCSWFAGTKEMIIKGDQQSRSIAAASILAKTHRDELMIQEHDCFPEYGFNSHKGYGAASHLQAIADFGATPLHRLSFAPLAPYRPKDFVLPQDRIKANEKADHARKKLGIADNQPSLFDDLP